MKHIKWSKVWDWAKRVGGVVITSVLVPYVSRRYGDGWGAVAGIAGAGAVHQAERFRKKAGRSSDKTLVQAMDEVASGRKP